VAKLIYLTNVSVDGFIEDEGGDFAWFPPDDEVFVFCTEALQSAGTFLYGRRLYEAMAVWETDPSLAARSGLMAEFAGAWQAADKIVYSTTLGGVSTARTSLESRFDPAAVEKLKATADRDITIGGADLAGQAIRAGLVDECQLLVWPLAVGGGKPGLPTGVRTNFEPLGERRFGNGVALLRYRPLGG
jgi:dihydrofolate reductase